MKIKRSPLNSPLARYVISIGITVAALLLYQALAMLVGGALPTYITFYPAVIFAGLFAGFWAALLATATTILLVACYILPPKGFAVSSLPDALGLAIFSFNSILISVIAERYRRARQRAADYAAELARRDERKKAEETLRESEGQFRTLADSIPNLAWWANGDGYITWYNRRWYEYTGTTPEQMEGWGWQSVHDPKVLPEVLKRWKVSIATGQPFDMEFPLRGTDGIFRTFLTRVLPWKDSAGQVLRWFGTNTDISAHKLAEEAQRRSEKQYRELFENMLEGFAYCKMVFENGKPQDFIYLSVNHAFETLTGLKNVVGKRVTEVIPGIREADPELFEIYGRVSLTGKPERFEMFVEALKLWFSISVYSTEKESFVAVFDVITERKLLEEVQGRLAAIVESAEDAIIGKDLNGVIQTWNVGAENIFGYKAEEVIGKPVSLLVPPGHTDEVPEILVRIKQGEHIEIFETMRMRKDGTIVPVSLKFSAVKDASGRIIGASKIAQDITERKRAEELIKERTRQLAASNKEHESFTYTVSHDLRAPLRAIDGFSRILQKENQAKLGEEGKRLLNIIRKNTQNMGQLIDDLLAFSRLGRQQVSLSEIDMTSLAKEVYREK